MFEAINEHYESGEITFEQAEELNEIAYGRYMTETSKATKEKKNNLLYNYQDYKKDYGTDEENGNDELKRRKHADRARIRKEMEQHAALSNEGKKSLETRKNLMTGKTEVQYNRKSPDNGNAEASWKRKQLMDKLDKSNEATGRTDQTHKYDGNSPAYMQKTATYRYNKPEEPRETVDPSKINTQKAGATYPAKKKGVLTNLAEKFGNRFKRVNA